MLASSNWITFEARDELTAAYEFLRRVEHRLQMVADEQTHSLPDDVEAVERFARFFGYDSRAAFARTCSAISTSCRGITSKLFEGDPTGTAKLPAVDYSAGPDDPRLLEHLAALGFKKPIMVAETVQQWMAGDYRVFRSEVDAQRLCRVRARADRRPGARRRARQRGDGVRPLPAGACSAAGG